MFCPNCGARAEPDAAFCNSCGAPLTPSADTQNSYGQTQNAPYPTQTPYQQNLPQDQPQYDEPFSGIPGGQPAWAQSAKRQDQRRGKKKWVIPVIAASVVAAVAIAALIWFFVINKDDQVNGNMGGNPPSSPTVSPTTPSPSPPPATSPSPDPSQPPLTPSPKPTKPTPDPSGQATSAVPSDTPDASPYPSSLSGIILETTDWIRLDARWANGTSTIFERDKDSPVWTMHSRGGRYRMVEPTFGFEGTAFTISFPTSKDYYKIFENGTGSFGNESLTWEFETSQTYSRGSASGANRTIDLGRSIDRYLLIVIRITWPNGETTIFYKQDNDTWYMKGRTGSFTLVEPRFRSSGSVDYMGFPTTSMEYEFYDNGDGWYDAEWFSWEYAFSDS